MANDLKNAKLSSSAPVQVYPWNSVDKDHYCKRYSMHTAQTLRIEAEFLRLFFSEDASIFCNITNMQGSQNSMLNLL